MFTGQFAWSTSSSWSLWPQRFMGRRRKLFDELCFQSGGRDSELYWDKRRSGSVETFTSSRTMCSSLVAFVANSGLYRQPKKHSTEALSPLTQLLKFQGTFRAAVRKRKASPLENVTASAREVTASSKQRGAELAAKMRNEYPRMFDPKYRPEWELYDEEIVFEDPLTRLRGMQAYRRNIEFLRESPVFGEGKLLLHDLAVHEPNVLVTRWTLSLRAKFVPFQPLVIFTGTSTYEWNIEHGRIVSHVDRWDSISRQAYFSPEGLRDLLAQLFLRPFRGLEGTVLYRFREFMIVQQRDGSVIARPVYRRLATKELRRGVEQTFDVHGYRVADDTQTDRPFEMTKWLRLHKVDASRKP